MKPDIHPKYFKDCKVTCSCGNTYITGSVVPSISVEVCGKCHPFYTGKEKFIDTEGRVEKYVKKVKFAESERAKKALKMAKKKEVEKVQTEGPTTLKDMLKQASK